MWRDRGYDEGSARRIVAVATARRAVRTMALWGVAFAIGVVTIAASYAKAYPTPKSRADLAASLSGNIGIAALYGRARALDTVAGFTAWRTGGLPWLGAIGALFVATRLLRGEEEAGRWELFLAGSTTRRSAAAQAVLGLGAGVGILWGLTALGALAVGSRSDVGFSTSASLFFAVSLVALPAVFAAAGVLTSQLCSTRRQANIVGGAALGLAFILRVVADAGVGVGWLRWLSPLGWVEELRPLTESRLLPLVPIVGAIVVLVAAALRVAARRDVGAGALRSRDTASSRTALLNGQLGLTIRLTWPVATAWIVGLALFGVLFGVVAVSAAKAVTGSTAVAEAIARLGGVRTGAAAFLGIIFVTLGAVIAAAAASHITSMQTEETSGHLDHMLARPVSRRRWLAGRLAAGTVLVLAAGVVGGLCAWAGSSAQGGEIGGAELVRAGLNITPPALFVLGIGGLVYAIRPRTAPAVAFGLVVWSFLVTLIAAVVDTNHWLLDTSLLSHVAPAPAADPNWTAVVWLAGLGLAAAVVAVATIGRRDLVTA
jgi:ABC-2 type transport system permease protein